MHLTDEQWRLIQPILPPPSPAARGRPLADDRLVLDGILTKLGDTLAWYDLPPGEFPSWQTCYRRYRQWQRLGLIDEIFSILWEDVRDRGGFDLNTAAEDGNFFLEGRGCNQTLRIAPRWDGTWQKSTVLCLLIMILKRTNKRNLRLKRRYTTLDLSFE